MAKKVSRFEKYTMFTKTKPWGYDPEEVEAEVNRLLELLTNLNNKIDQLKQVCNSKDVTIERLEEELKEMHFQMSSLELPDAEEAVEHFVLDEFKNYNTNEDYGKIDPPKVPDPEPSKGINIIQDKPKIQINKNKTIQNNDDGEDDNLNILF